MISCLTVDCRDADDEDLDVLMKNLTKERRSLAMSFTSRSDRVMSAVAGMCMKYLSERFSSPIVKLSNGKPVFSGADMYLSISHSRGIVAVAWSDHPVGVDVQSTDPGFVPNTCFMTDDEVSILKKNGADIMDVWSAKESFLKMTGDGISSGMERITTLTSGGIASPVKDADITVMHPLEGMVLAICGTGDMEHRTISYRELSPKSFR